MGIFMRVLVSGRSDIGETNPFAHLKQYKSEISPASSQRKFVYGYLSKLHFLKPIEEFISVITSPRPYSLRSTNKRDLIKRKSRARIFLALLFILDSTIAHSAGIQWGSWRLGSPVVSGADVYSAGNGLATPNTLQAAAATSATINPISWTTKNVSTTISLTNTFTVTPGPGDKNGDTIRGLLSGNLNGKLIAAGLGISSLTGSYTSSVSASVNAGFTNWSSPGTGTSMSGSVLFLSASSLPVNIPINKVAPITVGSTYEFSMDLTVSASANGVYQSSSLFDDGRGKLYATVSALSN